MAGEQAITLITKKSSGWLLGGLGKWVGVAFWMLFLIIPLIYGIYLGIESGNIGSSIDYIGKKLIAPTLSINEQALKAIDQGGLYQSTPMFWGGLWNWVVEWAILIGAVWVSYKWVTLFAWLMAKSPFSNKSNDFINIALGIIIFFLIQVLFLALSSPESGFMARAEYATTPFTAWWNLGKASPNFLKPATHIIDTMTGTNETILNVTGNITNG